jgi:hypothetical protein
MDLSTDPLAASALAPQIPFESPGKTRSACNRCHAQKLKCVRKAGQTSSCDRCLRLKTSCRFGLRAARSSLKFSEQLTIDMILEDPFPVPASMPMPIRCSNTPIAGINEINWLSPSDESAHTVVGCGQSATHILNQFYSRLTCHCSHADEPLSYHT